VLCTKHECAQLCFQPASGAALDRSSAYVGSGNANKRSEIKVL
jgi:hypothetical protein